MISKRTFVNTIEHLEEIDAKMDAVDTALKRLNNDFCGFYMTEPFDIVIGLLEEIFNDKEQWLSYFVLERNWLHSFELGDIMINGEAVKIENWEDVYDFLIENMEIINET